MGEALLEARLLDYDLVRQVRDEMNRIKVFRGYTHRTMDDKREKTHVLSDKEASSMSEALKCLRADIRYFKWRNGVVGHTCVVYVARDASQDEKDDVLETIGAWETARDLLDALESNDFPDSLLYATAALLEGCSFINGSGTDCWAMQCPGLIDLAVQQVGVYCLGTTALQTTTTTPTPRQQGAATVPEERRRTTTENGSSVVEITRQGFLSQTLTTITYSPTDDSILRVPLLLDAVVLCDFFSNVSWPMDGVTKALSYMFDETTTTTTTTTTTATDQLEELEKQLSAARESKSKPQASPIGGSAGGNNGKKKRVRIRPEEKTSEWAIPHNASIICAGLACVDMQLNQASGGHGGEAIETFEGEKSIGGGSVSMACKTLARLCHGAPLDDDYMQVAPPVVHSVVPLCKIGNDDSGRKLLSLLEGCGEASRNVETKHARAARRRDAQARTALAVLPIYRDGRRGCFFDAASNATFSPREMTEMIHNLTTGASGPALDLSGISIDEYEDYQERVVDATPAYGAFLFGYPHLLPMLQGEALARVMLEARNTMIEGGIIALDLNGVPEATFERGFLRTVSDLRNDAVIGAALEHVDILHMNEDELVLLTGCEIANTPESQLEDDFAIASAINLFLLCGVAIVVVTRGKKGSFVSCNDEQRFARSKMLPVSWVDCTTKLGISELPPDTVINTNGAGDSFTSGFLVATMLRHTGMTVPVMRGNGEDEEDDENGGRDHDEDGAEGRALHEVRPSRSQSPPPTKKPTPYQLYMRENYVSLKQQCNDDKKAIFTKCHQMWEQEDEEVKAMYERKAKEETEAPHDENDLRLVDAMERLDSTTPRQRSWTDDGEAQKNIYMTNRALNLESAVQFASLVAAHHVDVSTRDLVHLDVNRLLERALTFPEGLEEI